MRKLDQPDPNIAAAVNLLEGHHRFLKKNTGDTVDPHTDFFVQNTDGVLSNNRHFIADTMMEYQPNGDGTTEGQALEIIGYCHAYIATGKQEYLDAAKFHWDAYHQYFYAGQAIPSTPQRWICNWLVNSKQPTLADFPIDPVEPTHGGYKCVPVVFTNGEAQIPHGSPFWGEYLDVVTYAHRGHMTWNAINADVQRIQEDVDGLIDWQDVYDNYRVLQMPVSPHDPLAWIDWPSYLGKPSYTAIWSGADGATYPVNWMVAWTGNKIGIGPGPNDQLWDGDIIEEGLAEADKGKIQLQDTTINGVYLVNYAVKLPVEYGGYMFDRNEPWHNRPINTPFLGTVNQFGNAADAEAWFVDACYLLWKITGDAQYKQALDSVFYTAHEYTYIDATDKFFRQSKFATTPFADAISYDYSYPETLGVKYSRDSDGYIVIDTDADGQHYLEQQSVWFRINKDSTLRVTYGGLTDSGDSIGCRIKLDINDVKEDSTTPDWWTVGLPRSTSVDPVQYDVPLSSLAQLVNSNNGEEYLIANASAITEYGGCTWSEDYEANVYADNRSATVINGAFPDGDAGMIIGFWGTSTGRAAPNTIVYRSDAEFDVRIEDDNLWRWYWILPSTNGEWATYTFDPSNLILSGYQPNHSGEPDPSSPTYTTVDQFTVLLEVYSDTNKNFAYYCVNDVPPTFDKDDGWTITYNMKLTGDSAFTAKVGDCTILDFRLDSLSYCPGVIPFSNIYAEGTYQIGAWHGMPYPGYQYPLMYCIQSDPSYDRWLNNQIDFLHDSQQWYGQQFGVTGPGASAYVWDRWDNTTYGTANTWTMYHWGDGHAWDGYQPRAMMGGARAWYELAIQGKTVPPNLVSYVTNWVSYLASFVKQSGGRSPTYFPSDGPADPNDPGDFTGHMTGMYLGAACYAAMAGCQVQGLDELIDTLFTELADNYVVVAQTPGHVMNGSWSPYASPNDNAGMFYGFWAGEIMRGIGLYMTYKEKGPGADLYDLPY